MKRHTLSFVLPAILVVSVIACKEEPAALVVQPDAGDDLAPVDAGADVAPAADADAAPQACTGKISGYAPPPFHPKALQACTTAEIESYVAVCTTDDTNAPCVAWKADPAHATCTSCMFRNTDHDGPFRFYKDGRFASLNEGACVTLAGNAECGALVDAAYSCMYAACSECPSGDAKKTGACYEKVFAGDCKPFSDRQIECETTLIGSPAECQVGGAGGFEGRLRKILALTCGIPDAQDASADATPE